MAIFLLGPDALGNCCGCTGRTGPCDPCTPVTCECVLSLPQPLGMGVLPTLTSYEEVVEISGNSVEDCIMFFFAYEGNIFPSTNPVSTHVIAVGPTAFGISLTTPALGAGKISGANNWVSISVPDNTTLSFTIATNTTSLITAVLYDCNFNVIEIKQQDFSSNYDDSFNIATGNVYYLQTGAHAKTANLSHSSFIAVNVSNSFVINPVMFRWMDGATERKAMACPKMYIPPLTENTGSWYVDETSAQNAINTQTSNCVGYIVLPFGTFTATDNGNNLVLEGFFDDTGAQPTVLMYGSINVQSGQTISTDFSATESGPSEYVFNGFVRFRIYDYNGGLVYDSLPQEFIDTTSGTLSYMAQYTGRYIILCSAGSRSSASIGLKSISASFTTSSSGSFSVNPIQALYDTGLGCPARLDCV